MPTRKFSTSCESCGKKKLLLPHNCGKNSCIFRKVHKVDAKVHANAINPDKVNPEWMPTANYVLKF